MYLADYGMASMGHDKLEQKEGSVGGFLISMALRHCQCESADRNQEGGLLLEDKLLSLNSKGLLPDASHAAGMQSFFSYE